MEPPSARTRRGAHVAVLGAGVIGLTAAGELLRRHADLRVTVVHCGDPAEASPPRRPAADETKRCCSWGPAGIMRFDDERFVPLAEPTLRRLQQLHRKYSPDATGVHKASGYFFDEHCIPKPSTRHLYERVEMLEPEFVQAEFGLTGRPGAFVTTYLSHGRHYVPWLRSELARSGGSFARQTVASFHDLAEGGGYDAIVNCSGLGARTLCDDLHVRPRRGVLLELDAPWIRHFYYADAATYLLPGVHSVFLGGFKTLDDWRTDITQADRDDIWRRNKAVIPTVIQSAKPVGEWLGLRPARIVDGVETPRIEADLLPARCPGGRTVKLVHNYGHGGVGFCLSIGSAERAADLFDQLWPLARL